MGEAGVGWVTAIIVGGIAGWLAEQFMKSNMGLIMNIVLGIVGAAIASAILSALGISLGGWVGYLISGFIGAVLLIWIVRAVRPASGRQQNRTKRQLAARHLSITMEVQCITRNTESNLSHRANIWARPYV